jgi:hypothetical protein
MCRRDAILELRPARLLAAMQTKTVLPHRLFGKIFELDDGNAD